MSGSFKQLFNIGEAPLIVPRLAGQPLQASQFLVNRPSCSFSQICGGQLHPQICDFSLLWVGFIESLLNFFPLRPQHTAARFFMSLVKGFSIRSRKQGGSWVVWLIGHLSSLLGADERINNIQAYTSCLCSLHPISGIEFDLGQQHQGPKALLIVLLPLMTERNWNICAVMWPSEQRLALTRDGRVRYALKTPYRDGTTHVLFEPLHIGARTCLYQVDQLDTVLDEIARWAVRYLSELVTATCPAGTSGSGPAATSLHR